MRGKGDTLSTAAFSPWYGIDFKWKGFSRQGQKRAGCGAAARGFGAAGAPARLQSMNPAGCFSRKSILTLRQRLHASALKSPQAEQSPALPCSARFLHCFFGKTIIVFIGGLLEVEDVGEAMENPELRLLLCFLFLTPLFLPLLSIHPPLRASIRAGGEILLHHPPSPPCPQLLRGDHVSGPGQGPTRDMGTGGTPAV